jgi:S-formylglutathione hydrolase FrmB
MEKRKPTYEQDLALAAGRQTARANQRRRMAQKEADRRAAEARAEALASHTHGWRNWEYDFENMTETRTCREHGCDASETRPLSL